MCLHFQTFSLKEVTNTKISLLATATQMMEETTSAIMDLLLLHPLHLNPEGPGCKVDPRRLFTHPSRLLSRLIIGYNCVIYCIVAYIGTVYARIAYVKVRERQQNCMQAMALHRMLQVRCRDEAKK